MFDALERERAGQSAGGGTRRLRRAFRRDQNPASRRLLRAWRQIDGATDGGEVAANGREFTDLDLAGVNADANAERICRPIIDRGDVARDLMTNLLRESAAKLGR